MGSIKELQSVEIAKIKPYKNNAKIHGKNQLKKLQESISEFGFLTPCLIDQDFNLIAGHGRVEAAKALGMKEVPCVYIENLNETQRRAYILADNRLGELGEWDMDLVNAELEDLADLNFDINLTGFSVQDFDSSWFKEHNRNDAEKQEGNEEYNSFLDKFEIEKTTDDCYTPDNIYTAVADWVAEEYGLKKELFFRPFYPGGDYQNESYKGKIVVDNPPFSILSEIEQWFNDHDVKYFLFAPNTSNFPSKRKCCAICTGVGITYENGAQVLTSFVTNLENLAARTAPKLYQMINEANIENTKGREMPHYEYPDEVVTAAMLSYLSKYGIDFKLSYEDSSEKIGMLDCQKECGKGIFGGGFLISEKAAAEKAAAEKVITYTWELSERERQIVKSLSKPKGERDDAKEKRGT